MKRVLKITAVALLSLAVATTFLWLVLDWPPPRLLLKYGLPPVGGPTGREKQLAGFTFVELAPGYHHVEWHVRRDSSNWLESLCDRLGLPRGAPPMTLNCSVDEWVEVPNSYWISTWEVSRASILEFSPSGTWICSEADDPDFPAPAPTLAWAVEGRTREVTTDELMFAAAHGVWPGHAMLWPSDAGPERLLLLGRSWQGYDGAETEFATIAMNSGAGFADYLRALKSSYPWGSPPLIWIPPGD